MSNEHRSSHDFLNGYLKSALRKNYHKLAQPEKQLFPKDLLHILNCIHDVVYCTPSRVSVVHYNLDICFPDDHMTLLFLGCAYKGLKDPLKGLMDDKLATLDLSEKHSKDINAPLHMSSAFRITCDIDSNSGFLNKRGQWTALTNLSDSLKVDVRRDPYASFRRYLNLNVRSHKICISTKTGRRLLPLCLFCLYINKYSGIK